MSRVRVLVERPEPCSCSIPECEGRFTRSVLTEFPPEAVEALAKSLHPGKWWDEPELWRESIRLHLEEAQVHLGAVWEAMTKEDEV